ncbi:hypothetical protein LTR56_002502 [Elasticomyces elasticus]|nr:hypothetical protein LTR22_020203 [Elasticomyces elasticus]KAK3657360.1 hypothetical protein LTR56_002502 [Elasticomyces elasticus]KAK5754804.1 hypothetical protein LTS12_015121 [Elasticomyces elasticus]
MPSPPPLFGLSHRVLILYPTALEELQEDYTILPIDNAENRHVPLHVLVDDEQVRRNTKPDDYDLAVFAHNDAVSIGRHETVSTYRKLQPRILRSTVKKSDPERLVSDMKQWTAYNGHSWLELATYQKGDAEMRIRLIRTSHLRLDDGAVLDDNREEAYDMTFLEFEGLNLSDLWFTNALDVLHQRSDRALQHVSFHRRRQRLRRRNALQLKRKVLTDYMMLGKDLIVEDTNSVTDDVCPICQMNFDPTNNVIPLRLKCHPTHTICDDCYVTWAGTTKAVGCPHCRARMFTDDDLRMLIWGLGPTYKTYDPSLPTNQRFPGAWETFQRANHDLDRYSLPEDDMREFSFDALLLTRAWHYLIKGALLEPAHSTPYHLQPVRFPETTFITSVIRDVFDEFEGHTRTEPHKYALQAITRRLNAEFRNSAQWAILTLREQKVMKVNHLRYFGERRHGLETFLSRTLARTISFSNGRYCESDSVECQHAWHKHGEKAFFNRDYSADLEDE